MAAAENPTEIMAKEMQTKRRMSELDASIAEHEGYASQALDKGDEALALDIASKIAEFEGERAEQEEVLQHLVKAFKT